MQWKKVVNGREPTEPRMQRICEALRRGDSYAAIAKEFKISIPRVAQIREFAGIERRRKSRAGQSTISATTPQATKTV
jgi:transposase-like protein